MTITHSWEGEEVKITVHHCSSLKVLHEFMVHVQSYGDVNC